MSPQTAPLGHGSETQSAETEPRPEVCGPPAQNRENNIRSSEFQPGRHEACATSFMQKEKTLQEWMNNAKRN